jgi:peptidyl-prolyl cis-trans isomerase SurA
MSGLLAGMAPLPALLAQTQEQAKGQVIDKIIAKVDDYIVLKSELERAYLELLSRGEPAGAQTRCQVLEGLVLNKLMVAKAEIDSVVVEDDLVDRELDMRFNAIIAQVGGDEKVIEEYYKKSVAEFKEELRTQVKEQKITEMMQAGITEEIKVSPEEVKRFFRAIPKDSLPYFSTEVSIGQIVKKPKISTGEKERLENILMQIRDRVLKGDDFQDMARKYSQDPSAPRGGNLGTVRRGDMVAPFEAAALKLKDGEVSLPVETEFGFHLIQMVERRGNEYNCRHILLIPRFNEEDFRQAARFLDSLRVLIETDSLSFDKAAKEHSEDKESSGNGGYVRASTGSNLVPVSELDPGLFFTMDTMQVGSISHPMRFTMRDGKEAMRVIYYKTKVRPHQANLEEDYQKIQMAAMNAKRSRVMSDWFREAREQVFIEIDPEYDNCDLMN